MRITNEVFTDDRVVIDEQARWLGHKLECDSARDIIENIADEVGRPAEDGLGAQACMGSVHSPVAHDPDIVHAAVSFDEVVPGHVNVVVVEVDRNSLAVLFRFGRAVRGDADAVMEVGDGVVADDVA
jgi:hypothetical protein